jgi:hypothetical protein
MTFHADRNPHGLVIGGGAVRHLCRSRLREVSKDLLPAEKPLALYGRSGLWIDIAVISMLAP